MRVCGSSGDAILMFLGLRRDLMESWNEACDGIFNCMMVEKRFFEGWKV